MNVGRVGLAVVAIVLLDACGASPTAPVPELSGSASSVSSAPAAAGQIPVGVVWSKTLTTADAKRFGVLASTAAMHWAPGPSLTVKYKFGDSVWTQFANYDGGVQQPGDGGRLSYSTADELQLTSDGSGESYRYRYRLDGTHLTLTMQDVPDTQTEETRIVRMMSEGTYRQDPT